MENKQEQDNCIICMEEKTIKNFLIKCNKCTGYYHFKCINHWINTNNNYCPICKTTPFFRLKAVRLL